MSAPGSPRAHGARLPPEPARGRSRIQPPFFEDLYARLKDPWEFATSDYERDKYAHTLSALRGRQFARALEVGCSIGVFTEQLARVCADLVAVDVSQRALERARLRVGPGPTVSFAQATFPEEMPAGPWGLVVCSEVLYYLDAEGFALALERLRVALESGATVLAVHWRAPTRNNPLRGDEVHDRLRAELGAWHALDDRRAQYRLDRFERV